MSLELADSIRERMARVRSEMGEEVEDLVDSARTLADWRYYVKQYPWACVGVAAALGFMVVPRRLEIIRPNPEDLVTLAKRNKLVVTPHPRPEARGGLVGAAFGLMANAMVRGVIDYLGQKTGKVVSRQAQAAESTSNH